MIKYPIIILTFSLLLLHNLGISLFRDESKKNNFQLNENLSSIEDLSSVKDTLYTKHNNYFEVDLAKQTAYLHSRDGSVYEFPISSGNEKLKDGVNTNEGIFVIQALLPSWNSEQFDSTLLLYWMGFNHGIGFHAMLGSNYYRYLGKKNLSHGCIRISRDDARFIYPKIDKGTPVLVHSNNDNIVCVSFADTSDSSYQIYNYKNLKKILNERIENLEKGVYFLKQHPKLLIDLKNVKHDGLPIGNTEKAALVQIKYPKNNFFVISANDNLNLKQVKLE